MVVPVSATTIPAPTSGIAAAAMSEPVVGRSSQQQQGGGENNYSPLIQALLQHRVTAHVVTCDHYRIRGGLAVESDYIVSVKSVDAMPTVAGTTTAENTTTIVKVEPFTICKTYSAFRTLAYQLKKASDKYSSSTGSHSKKSAGSTDPQQHKPLTSPACLRMVKYCELVSVLIESQRTQYLGKVNYMYVQVLAKQRSHILNEVLEATCHYFPSTSLQEHVFLEEVALLIETFFLTDHCACADEDVVEEEVEAGGAVVVSSHEAGLHRRAKSMEPATTTTTTATTHNKIPAQPFGHRVKNLAHKVTPKKDDFPFDLNPLNWLQQVQLPSQQPVQPPTVVSQPDDTNTAGTRSASMSSLTARPLAAAAAAAVGHGSESMKSTTSTSTTTSVVVPMTRRTRRSIIQRVTDEQELQQVGHEAQLLLDDDRPSTEFLPSYARPVPVVQTAPHARQWVAWMDNHPAGFLAIAIMAIALLKQAATITVSMDGDVALLGIFACFCLGLHTPRPMVGGFDQPPAMKGTVRKITTTTTMAQVDVSGRKLLRRSMMGSTAVKAKQRKSGSGANAATMVSTITMAEAAELVQRADYHDKDLIILETRDEVFHDEELMGLEEEDEEAAAGLGPLAKFPDGAKIGSHHNCWSEPDPADFQVRGPNYLLDKKKIGSAEYLFPCRGIDLFLTDACPEHVASNPCLFGGRLRDVPTFLINFRLPWGVLVFYFEIPSKYIPFLRACYEPDFDQSTLPDMSTMTGAERSACRFLLKDMAHKNSTLKILPVVIDGPWVVKQVVGGKPAIIGNKLPINYVYQPAQEIPARALYLEADLDIAASSAARGILSVARSYTQILTLNLGFVVQGNAPDELPEQMLVGCRLHGIDPLTAPTLPITAEHMPELLLMNRHHYENDHPERDSTTTTTTVHDSARPRGGGAVHQPLHQGGSSFGGNTTDDDTGSVTPH